MGVDEIISGMKKAMCSGFSTEPRGINAFMIHTGFTYPDGDELHIMLRQKDGTWILTDDGHTMMWLSYENVNMTASRMALLTKTLGYNYISFDEGQMWVAVDSFNSGNALKSMIQALVQAADILYLNRQNVQSTFSEDVKELFREVLGDRCEFNKKIKSGKDELTVDIYVESDVPLLIFTITSLERCKDASYSILSLTHEYNKDFTSVSVIDDKVDITKEDRKRISNRSDRVFFGLPGKDDELPRFLHKSGIIATT